MLGPPKRRRFDEPIAVSLEGLIPQDNFYRHLEAKLDLSFVRDWVRELYAERGWPSIDPVVFFKLQLVMFFEGIVDLCQRWKPTPAFRPWFRASTTTRRPISPISSPMFSSQRT